MWVQGQLNGSNQELQPHLPLFILMYRQGDEIISMLSEIHRKLTKIVEGTDP